MLSSALLGLCTHFSAVFQSKSPLDSSLFSFCPLLSHSLLACFISHLWYLPQILLKVSINVYVAPLNGRVSLSFCGAGNWTQVLAHAQQALYHELHAVSAHFSFLLSVYQYSSREHSFFSFLYFHTHMHSPFFFKDKFSIAVLQKIFLISLCAAEITSLPCHA